MRALALAFAIAGALHAGLVQAQRRPATEADAMSYITSAFVSQADPGALSAKVVLGPELEKALGLAPGADRAKVYQAVVPLAEDPALEVRRAAPAEVAAYGKRRGFDPSARHPLFTVETAKARLLVQYDLQALNVVYVGQLGLPDPDPRPVAPVVSAAWSGEFPYDSASLTPELRARLDSEVIPKLIGSRELHYLNLYGHADRLGTPDYNQRLSEKRAEAVRDYLVANGIDGEAIEVYGFGKTLPVKSCPGELPREELIACLAPNRRIVVELRATP
jgi:outer membrane protein OmpA-like peptidoglycan-associated protein